MINLVFFPIIQETKYQKPDQTDNAKKWQMGWADHGPIISKMCVAKFATPPNFWPTWIENLQQAERMSAIRTWHIINHPCCSSTYQSCLANRSSRFCGAQIVLGHYIPLRSLTLTRHSTHLLVKADLSSMAGSHFRSYHPPIFEFYFNPIAWLLRIASNCVIFISSFCFTISFLFFRNWMQDWCKFCTLASQW